MYVNDCGENSAFCGSRVPRPVRQPWCRVRVITENDEPSMTQQSHKDQTDVNAIVERFQRTGQLPPAIREPTYADVTELQGDYTEMVNRARQTMQTASEFAASWVETPPETQNSTQDQNNTEPAPTPQGTVPPASSAP